MTELLKTGNTIIVGKKRSGKTLEGFRLARNKADWLGQKIYTFRHPNDKLVAKMLDDRYEGNITNILELKRLRDCIVVIDEAHIHFNTLEKRINSHLRDILGLSTQNGVSLIFITHAFQFLNESLMASYIDVVMIKQVNDGHWDMERRYAKRLYDEIQCRHIGELFVHVMSTNERLYINTKIPTWWKDDFSYAYKNAETNPYELLFL